MGEDDKRGFWELEQEDWLHIGIGLVIAIVALLVPILGYIFGYLGILVHEMGHTLFAWMFGYPSIPAFDFAYGGGVTRWQERSTFIRVLVWAGLAALVFYSRHRRPALIAAATLAVCFALVDMSRWHRAVMFEMGHGTELIVAIIFLYRALSGVAVKTPLERPLYAGVGFFLVLHNLRFAWGLMTDSYKRELYSEGKASVDMMDFTKLMHMTATSVETVAAFHLMVTLAVIPLACVLFHYREWIGEKLHAIFAKS